MLVFPAVLLPLSTQFDLSMVDTLALSFWMYLLFGLTALPWGIASDRFGAKSLLSIFYFGAGVCGILAAWHANNPVFFGIALSGIGLFSGIYHPAGLGWIGKEIKNTSRGMAYNGMFGNLGLAVAPLCAGLVNYFFGVQVVYIVVGGLNFLGLFLIAGTRASSSIQVKKDTRTNTSYSSAPFLILLVAMMMGGIIYRGTSVTLPAYFELSNVDMYALLERMFGGVGSENVVATIVTSLIYFVGMAGQYAGGRVGENYDLRRGYLLFHVITIPAVLAMAFTTNLPLIGFAMLHSFFLLGMQPIENTLVARLTPPGIMSSAYGLKFILTFGVGALSVKMVEIIKVYWGFSSVYLIFSGISTLLVVTIVILILSTSRLRL